MLTADLRHVLLSAARDRGHLIPPPGDPVLRPGGAPGRYVTALPPRLAPRDPRPLAAAIATELRRLDWIASVTPAPLGYLTIDVTGEALDRLAVRIAEAGPACARSDALAGTTLARPQAAPDREGPWAGPHATVLFQVTAALGAAAGASVPSFFDSRRLGPAFPEDRASGPGPASVAFAGPDAIRYTLARTPAEHLVPPDPQIAARHIEANPAYAVQYAYSCAATTLRWAADLGLSRGPAEQFRPGSLAHPRERALLDALSWLPEQVARAARRGRPHEFTTFCEELAETYQVCRVTCPAWPERQPVRQARLWLTAAVAASLAAALGLLGLAAPDRL